MKIFLSLLLLISFHVQAQQLDSLQGKQQLERKPFKPKKIQPFIIPAVFITYGLISLGDNPIRDLDLSTRNELTEDHPAFAAHVDDYIEFAPLLAMYGLDIAGIKGKNRVGDQTAMVLITTGITTAMVSTLKNQTHRLRPDGSSYNSFPSGHTATAFAAAELLNQEFKEQIPWIGYAGYTIATATGVLRMYNNKHWVSDVVAGAGFGILSTKLTYLLYPQLKKLLGGHQQNLQISPSYQQGQFGYRIAFKL